ncbi:MAG: hypothetical protein AAFY26_00770 [Cyanobacteria bacterium J06638_22]
MDHDTAATCNGSEGYLYAFKSEGFGRLRTKSLQLVQQWGLKYWAGATDDPTRVSELLQAQGVTLPTGVHQRDLGGVYWA